MNLVFLGPPGAGKGTIAAKAKQILNVPHISTGELFRAAVKNESELGKQIESTLASGELVPDETTISVVRQRLADKDSETGFILDGFPRTIPQAEALEKLKHIDYVINFLLDRKEIIKRLSGRRMCKSTGRIYHLLYDPPRVAGIDDDTGEPLIQRDDDKEEAIIHRIAVYEEQTAPLIAYYEAKGLLKNINAKGTPEEVLQQMLSVIGR